MTLTTQLNETGLTFSDVAAHMGVRDLGLLETGCVFLPGQWGQQLGENQPACRIPADRVVREIRAMLLSSIPEVASPVPHVGCAWQRLPNEQHLLSLLNYGDEPVRGLEILWPAKDGWPVELMAYDAQGMSLALPVINLGGGRGTAGSRLDKRQIKVASSWVGLIQGAAWQDP
jgi:hypothetical protein